MKRRYPIILLGLAISAFFPAYLGYQPQYAWVGYLFTIAFALSSYLPWLQHHRQAGFRSLLAVMIWGVVIETIGLNTCRPYGCFQYSSQLGPTLIGGVPRLLIATYPPLVLGVYQYIKKLHLSGPLSRFFGGIGLMLVDLILDPIAVQMGLWSYPGGGLRFGVPLSNFVGRIISGTIATFIIDSLMEKKYNPQGNYKRGLWLNLIFFICYMIWKFIL